MTLDQKNLLILFGTQDLHIVTIKTITMIEKLVDEHEINIESFKASATRNEFEEMVIFWMFCICMTMTGYIDSINKISPSNKQINHLQETMQLFKLYYVR